MGGIHIEQPNPQEVARRQALVQRILASRKRRVVAPMTTANLVAQAREQEYSAYGKPRPTR